MKITGDYKALKLNVTGEPRLHASVYLKIGDLIKYTKAYWYDADTNKGEQRQFMQSHGNRLLKEALAGNITPTEVHIGLHDEHRKNLKLNPDGTFEITVSDTHPLPLIDGQHRNFAFKELVDIAAKVDAKRIQEIKDIEIPCRLQLNGNPRVDFVNLQSSKTVNSSHLLSMKVNEGLMPKKYKDAYDMAMKAAKLLHANIDSPFYNCIKFDSRGSFELPINSIMSKSSSDLLTSLYGAAKLAIAIDSDEQWISDSITNLYLALFDANSKAIKYGNLLCPPSDEGKKGSSGLLIAVGILVGYRQFISDDFSLEDAVKIIEDTMAVSSGNGNLTAASKRNIVGQFCKDIFDSLSKISSSSPDKIPQLYEGIPIDLINHFSCSAFGIKPMPKVKKPKVKIVRNKKKAGLAGLLQTMAQVPTIEEGDSIDISRMLSKEELAKK